MTRNILIALLLTFSLGSFAQSRPTLIKPSKAQTNTTVITPNSEYKHAYSHAIHFSLQREIAIIGKVQEAKQLAKLIDNAGGKITKSSFKKMVVPQIKFKRKRKIHPTLDPDVLKIIVTPDKVTVTYNTDEAALKAMDILVSMIKETPTGWIISGCDITHWGDFAGANAPTVKIKKGQIEMAPKMITRHSVQGVINKQPHGATIILSLISNSSWAVESNIMTQDCPEWKYIKSPFAYTQEQIKFLVEYARKRKVTIMLRLDINNKCAPFIKATGHLPTTAEGMRFSRAVIEELARTTGAKHFLVPHDTRKFQYTALLLRVAELNNITIQY